LKLLLVTVNAMYRLLELILSDRQTSAA
jgi:hypothetical protein